MNLHGKDIKIFAGNSNKPLAAAMAECLGITLGRSEVGRFSDGEIQAVKIGTSLKNPQGQRHQLRDRGAKGGEIQCLNESNLLRPNAHGATA